jgi:hypothetical protein
MNPSYVPYLVEGEIIQVQSFFSKGKKIFRYNCSVLMPNGARMPIPNVEMATMFGGIGDYVQRRARTTTDDGNKVPNQLSDANLTPTIGERVLISFIGGSIQYPVIVGFLQHPSQTEEFTKEPESVKPQAVFQYLGVRFEVSDSGAIRCIKKGAPKVKYTGGGPGGLLGAAIGAASSLLRSSDSSAIKGNDNAALEPADDTEVVLWEMLDEGVFRIRDAEGQMFEIDRTKMRIYISNNDLKSTEDASGGPLSGGNLLSSNSTDAEYILLDKDKELVLINARSTAQIYSFDERKDVTEGIHTHEVGKDSEWTIGGNETVAIDGNRDVSIEQDDSLTINGDSTIEIAGDFTETIEGDKTITVSGDQVTEVTGDLSDNITGSHILNIKSDQSVKITGEQKLSATGGITLEAVGAKLKLANGKVGLGGPTAELLDLLDQQLDAIINNAPTFVSTSVGPGVLNPAVVSLLTQIKTLLGTIKGGI